MPFATNLPADVGLCFKPQHFDAIRATDQPVGFFEVHAENYMGAGGPPHARLAELRRDYALSLHGVGLSIGSAGTLDPDHMSRLAALCERYEPDSFSEHLAWSTHDSVYFNDLLPLPYTRQTLDRVVEHVDQVQAVLGRPMLLENPASYLTFAESTYEESAFLREVAARTGCGLLLDVNNVFVSAANLGTSARDYLAGFPLDLVGEIHLAGHDRVDDGGCELLIDAHNAPVADEVWALFADAIDAAGALPTLIEWDNDVPDWPVLLAEAAAARPILARAAARRAA